MKLSWVFCILMVANAAVAKSFGEDRAGTRELSTEEDWFGDYMDAKDREDVAGDSGI